MGSRRKKDRRSRGRRGEGAGSDPSGRPLAPSRWHLPLGLALLLLATLLAYRPTFSNGFVLDDALNITGNRVVLGSEPWTAAFSGDYWEAAGGKSGFYRPLFVLANLAVWRLGGGAPAAFHAVVLAAHLAAVLMLVLLARRLGCSTLMALMAGALLALHPVATDVVCAASGLKEAGSLAFVLAAVAAALALAGRGRFGAFGPAASAALLLAGLGFREAAAVGVVVIPAAVFLAPGEGSARRRFQRAAASLMAVLAVFALYAVVASTALGGIARPDIHPVDNLLATAPAGERIAGSLALVPKAASLVLWPAGLSPDYDRSVLPAAGSPLVFRATGGVILLLAVVAAALLGRRRPAVVAGAVILLASYLPTANLLFPIGTLFAERFLYMPLAGLALMVAGALPGLPRGERSTTGPVLLLVASLVLLLLGVRTHRRVPEWRDGLSLYSAAVRVMPDNGKMQGALGAALRDRGRPAEALPAFDRAVTLLPEHALPWTGRAGVRKALGDLPGAIDDLSRARELDPEEPIIASNLGNALRGAGRLGEARDQFDAAVELGGKSPLPPMNRAFLNLQEGKLEGARRDLELALERDPCAHMALGELLLRFGAEAADSHRRVYRERCASVPGFDPRLAAADEAELSRSQGGGPGDEEIGPSSFLSAAGRQASSRASASRSRF